MTHDEIAARVREVLANSLGIDEEEATPDATLVGDLGAESIDFLDISFQLEQAFGFKIAQGEMIPLDVMNDARYVVDGRATPEGVAKLTEMMPWVDFSTWKNDPLARKVPHAFTVEAIVRFVEQKLARQPA